MYVPWLVPNGKGGDATPLGNGIWDNLAEMPPVMVVPSTPNAFVYDDYLRIVQTNNTSI